MKNFADNNIELVEVFTTVLTNLPERSQEIVGKRFGAHGGNPMTLQAIGDEYNVTRERVRQIVQSGLKNVKNTENVEIVDNAKAIIVDHIESNNGIVSIDDVIVLGSDTTDQGVIRFMVEGMDEVEDVNNKKYPVIKDVVSTSDFNIEEWNEAHTIIKNIFKSKQKTYPSKRLQEKMEEFDINEDIIIGYLKISSEIDKNPFDKWGLIEWDEITPRGVREKSLLIMKEEDRPMHFREIAQAIDDYGLGKNGKKSHPQTVHNELIRDNNFVLVGRGVYALDAGNYQKGTVKDVITNILKNSNESLTLDEVVESVLDVRQVKPSTVKVNLSTVAKKINDKYVLDTKSN